MRTGACEPQVPFQGSKDLGNSGDSLVVKNTCCASVTCVQILSIYVNLGMAVQACNPSISWCGWGGMEPGGWGMCLCKGGDKRIAG